MARRRMFSLDVVDTDLFLDMPISARLLYYDLGMRADDDGFLQSAQRILRTIGASKDDMNVLISRGFVIPFESGVIVIRHWKQNNELKKDRYKRTVCLDELALLAIDEAKKYELQSTSPALPPAWIQDGDMLETQSSRGKSSTGQVSKEEKNIPTPTSPLSSDSNMNFSSLISDYNLPDTEYTRKALAEDMQKSGMSRLRKALEQAVNSNSREKVSIAYYRKILYNNADPYADYSWD